MKNGVWCEMLFILLKGDSVSCTNMNEMEDTVLSETIQTLNDALRSCFYVGSKMTELKKIQWY